MNPDQEVEVTTTTTSSSVNDPYENIRKTASRRKSKYAKEQPPPPPTIPTLSSSIVDGTTFIIPSRSSTSMNLTSPPPPPLSYQHQEEQKVKRRQESKELFTIHQQHHHHHQQQQDEFYSKNLLIASTLVVTYLIEVTVQILLLVQCCRSIQKLELLMDSLLESTTSSISSWSWVLLISSVGSSLLVTLISIIWVFRGMDFSGRLCGRLLCYVMHSFLLALLWRYLKLAFAYDRADLEEFFRLKTIQTYVQSLPLVTIHLAWLLMAQQLLPVYFYQSPFDSYHALSSWLVVAEMLSVVTSLLVLSSVSSTSTSPSSLFSSPTCASNYLRGGKIPKKKKLVGKGDNNPNHLFNDSGTASTIAATQPDNQDGMNVMMVKKETRLKTRVAHYSRKSELGRALLLISRLISLGMLVYEMNYWTGFITLLHLAVCFAWLSLWVILTSGEDDTNDDAHFGDPCDSIVDAMKINNKNCDSSANDSGLVVKSDADVVKMEKDYFHHHHNHHQENSLNVEYCDKQSQSQVNNNATESFNSFTNLCKSVVMQRIDNDNPPGNNQRERINVRQVLIRVILPLTYLLFWDLSSSPLLIVTSTNRLNLWATALPVLLTAVENMSITIFHWYNQQNMIWTVASGTCLLFGWLFVAASYWQRERKVRQEEEELHGELNQVQVQVGDLQDDSELCDDDDHHHDAHANSKRQMETGRSEKSVNKKETGECLSMCCSSLSHPLNIKRKGHPHHQEHNFCGPNDNDYDKKDFGNEYEQQPQLMNAKQHHHNSNSGRSNKKGIMVVPKNSIMFPDLGITSAHTGVALEQVDRISEEDHSHHHHHEAHQKRESMMTMMGFHSRYQEDVMACAPTPTTKPAPTTTNTTPVTNNYTNIKEALTRRISNKSCASSSKKQNQNHHHQQQHHHCMNQDRESVKGEVEVGLGEVVISSFKSSSSSPSNRLPQPPPPTNSNKCMPISIKSPISWLPETCCNDSSGSGGSSNSRNTNTLVLPDPRFYCPENYIDLDNNNETIPKPVVNERVRGKRGGSDDCDFSIVFFEDRGTSRKPKQKQSRSGAAAATCKPVRSSNPTPTPVISSQHFPLDITTTPTAAPTSALVRQHHQHQHFHPHSHLHPHHHDIFVQQQQHQYNLDDDPIEKASKGTRRNQIMGKTYLSDGGSLTSLDGLCEIRASTPVEIKKASRVIVNYPPPHHQIEDSKTVSRCLCKVDGMMMIPTSSSSPMIRRKCPDGELVTVNNVGSSDKAIIMGAGGGNSIYEKLIDDSYGILICEGESTPHQSGSGAVSSRKNGNNSGGVGSGSKKCIVNANKVTISSEGELASSCRVGGGNVVGSGAAGVHVPTQKLRILCAKCLENHDPLLTNCLAIAMNQNHEEHDHDDDENDEDDQDEIENSPYTNKNHYNPSSINVNLKNPHQNHQHHVHFGLPNKSLPQLVSHLPTTHHHPSPGSDTTDYPSDTEFTNNNVAEDDGQSLSTHFSSATCTWHHNNPYQPTQLSQFIWAASSMMPTRNTGDAGGSGGGDGSQCPKEFTSLEYVRTWLMASHPRTFAINNITNNTHQHPHHHHQQGNSISDNNKRSFCQSGGNSQSQRAKTLTPKNSVGVGFGVSNNWHSSSSSARINENKGSLTLSSSKNKSSCDKTISKKKRFRQLEKRQRPIGRGASPPAKELSATNNNISNNIDVSKSTTSVAPAPPTAIEATAAEAGSSSSPSARLQPPPSRKQHPLLFYDMIPRQPQQKPLTGTAHKKCRDQLDLFHKELETVV
ncbi:unnamed protein product [Orchesella dallaii]|uniref:XK-related protein n=1 Tax=Orchesella dallaii TaxID=48710 RepID=A0ABP1PMW6_9HEXA